MHTFTPLLGAQLDLDPGAPLTLEIDDTFEHGVLLDQVMSRPAARCSRSPTLPTRGRVTPA